MSALLQFHRKHSSALMMISLFCLYTIAAKAHVSPQEPTALNSDGSKTQSGNEGGQKVSTEEGKPASEMTSEGESLTTLRLPAHANPGMPVVQLPGKFPEYTRDFVEMEWRAGDEVDLYVLKPVGVEKPPVILYLYSFPSDKDRFAKDNFAKIATKNGFAAVGFVSALTGQRYHGRPMKEWFVSEMQEALGESVHDVQYVLNYLENRGDLDMSRVGMYADGSGASIAIMAAAVDPRIKALDLVDPWGDWPDWLYYSTLVPDNERENYLKPEFLKKVAPLDPVTWLPKLTAQRVRLQFLGDDKVTPEAAMLKIRKAAGSNITISTYATSRQFIAGVGGRSGERIFDWVKLQLPAAAGQKVASHNGGELNQDQKN
jgi:hypothetical protein